MGTVNLDINNKMKTKLKKMKDKQIADALNGTYIQ